MTVRNGRASQSMQQDTDKPTAICYALIVFVLMLIASCAVQAGQAYYSPISINSAQVPSTQTDFPVLVSQTDNRFKTIGNGGHVANSNGYDIRPYSDSGLTTAITGYELERYNASTGEVVMWVKVGSLSSSTTPIYLGYGDSGLTTDGSSTTTWSNNFSAVYHLKDGTSLNLNDSTSNGNNGTNHSTTATTGNIDGGNNYTGASSQYVGLGNGSSLNISGAITMSCWVNMTSFPSSNNLMVMISKDFVGGNKVSYLLDVWNDAGTLKLRAGCYNGSQHGNAWSISGWSTGTWKLVHGLYNGTAWRVYLNGAFQDNVIDGTGAISGTDPVSLGNTVNTSRYLDGKLDEARISNTNRSDDWITTEYNNQSAPGTFETLGTEVSVSSSSASGWFYFFP